MNTEQKYICKLINEMEQKDAKIAELSTKNNEHENNVKIAVLEVEKLILEKQVDYAANKNVALQETVDTLRKSNAELTVKNEELKNENWEMFTQKDNQEKIENTELQNIKEENATLQQEVEKMETLVNKDITYLSKKDNEISSLKEENEALNNRVNEMKEQLKVKNTPAPEEEKAQTQGETYSTMDIFQKIKEGSLIQELKLINGRGKGGSMSSHPFVLQLGNCCAFFNETQSVACLEKGEVSTYIPINMEGVSTAVTSSMREFMGINMDFKVAQRKDLKGHTITIKKVLQCKQLISKEGYLCSHEKYTWYIYQENDGSRFIVLPNGEKEVV